MKILRWMIGIVVVILVLLVIGVVFLVNFVNPNDYREQISQAISGKIHKPFVIQGDISWLFFPELGFKVNDMTIGNKNSKDLYAKLNTLEINFKLWPLIHKKIALDALRLDGIEMVLPASAASSEVKAPSSSDASALANSPVAALAALPQLSLLELSIKDANISQLDTNGKVVWTMKNLSLNSSHIGIGHEFPLQVKFDYGHPEKNFGVTVRFSAIFNWESENQNFIVKTLKLWVNNDENSTPKVELNLEIPKVLANLTNHSVTLNHASGSFNQLNFMGDNISVTNFDTNPNVSADWSIDTNSLSDLAHSLDINLPSALLEMGEKFVLKTHIQYSDNQLTLNPFSVQLNNNNIQGQIKSNDVKNMAMVLSLQSPVLSSQGIVMNDLKLNLNILPPLGTDKNWAASTVNGSVNIKNANLAHQNFKEVQIQLDGKNQIFNLIKFHTLVFGGSVDSTGVVNLQANVPKFTMNPSVRNIQVNDLLKAIEPKFNLTGLASMHGSLSSQGMELAAIKRNLNGNLKVSVKNGVLHGLDLGYWVNAASALYHRESLPAQSQGAAQTQFGDLSATLAINQGVISNQDLLLMGPIAQAKGQGTIDLNRESLNYRLQISKMNADTQKAHSGVVPLMITGSFDNPSIQPDMSLIAKQVISKQIEDQKDRLVKKVMGDDLAASPLEQQISGALGQWLGN